MDINRKRIVEECRRSRIFNAKQRQIGIDVKALNNQVRECRLIKEKEEENDRRFAEEAKWKSQLGELLERQKDDEIRERNKKLAEFWKTEQRAEERKEFDVYDPDQKKKPAYIVRSCSVSGLQKFECEDLERENRLLKQKKEVQDVLLQQILEKRMRKMKEETEKREWTSVMSQRDSYNQKMDELAMKRRQEASIALIAENQRLAKLKEESLARQKIEDNIEKEKDIEFHVHGCLLRETHGKEMSKEQLKEFYDEHLKQMAEKQKKKDQELYEKSLWDKQLRNMEDSFKRLEEERNNSRRKLDKDILLVNELLAQEQRRQQEFLNRVYTNVPSKEFFEQFNTTSR
ncbi:hypothetical protein JTE90_024961 [Oedothorax gibbosus]|uniref:RIB43A-like with coiled-coils protein 2 n=1 Tax=Oedothorax gibbosus TaxID=931172 RepID=A0AAV6VWM5_9ARAC|nr:hypothetical protein JTE90_024961 [Oedothorax gibbosus]